MQKKLLQTLCFLVTFSSLNAEVFYEEEDVSFLGLSQPFLVESPKEASIPVEFYTQEKSILKDITLVEDTNGALIQSESGEASIHLPPVKVEKFPSMLSLEALTEIENFFLSPQFILHGNNLEERLKEENSWLASFKELKLNRLFSVGPKCLQVVELGKVSFYCHQVRAMVVEFKKRGNDEQIQMMNIAYTKNWVIRSKSEKNDSYDISGVSFSGEFGEESFLKGYVCNPELVTTCGYDDSSILAAKINFLVFFLEKQLESGGKPKEEKKDFI